MSLNIKSDEIHRLVHKLAKLTGETMTTAVKNAVRERLDRELRDRRQNLAERLVEIGKQCAKHISDSYRTIDHGELLYDERGLPR